MKISARNQFKGKVKKIEKGAVAAKVVLDVNGMEIVSVVTVDSVNDLDIQLGDEITALIKASDVILGK